MSLIPQKQIDFWIKNNLNVLFAGHAGVGKTHAILDAFKKHNLKFQYYSCSTLDPYVDFIGVPKEVDDANGNKVLDLVRPKQWANDEIEALFLDEFNRSKMAVRNAVMELIQFKSINGKKFNNLKIVWAAINPNDSENDSITYDVEDLDPAQKDRFHIHYNVPYELDSEYFGQKYGQTTYKIALEWWKSLDEKTKMKVSPRRVDYAVEINSLGGDIEYVLPKESNPKLLKKKLSTTSVYQKLEEFSSKSFTDTEVIKNFLKDQSNLVYSVEWILKDKKTWDKFLPNIPPENFNSLIVAKENTDVLDYIIKNNTKFEEFFTYIKDLPEDSLAKKYVTKEIVKKGTTLSKDLLDKFSINENAFSDANQQDIINWLKTKTHEVKNHAAYNHRRTRGRGPTNTPHMTTYEKKKLIVEHYENMKKNPARTKELISAEMDFLEALASRMQSSNFENIFTSSENLKKFYKVCIDDYDQDTKLYKSHFKPWHTA